MSIPMKETKEIVSINSIINTGVGSMTFDTHIYSLN